MTEAVMCELETSELETSVKSQALEVFQQARTFIIVNQDDYIEACNNLKIVKTLREKITGFFEKGKKLTYDAWKHSCQQEKDALKPTDEADTLYRAKINDYLNEQERIRREAQRKAEEAASLIAEKEKQRLMELAIKAEEKGKAEKAEALLEKAEAVYQEPVAVPSTVEKTTRLETGSVTRKTDIQVTVQDEYLLIKAIAEKLVPITVIEFKTNTLKTWVKTAGIKNGQIPGLLVKEVQAISVR